MPTPKRKPTAEQVAKSKKEMSGADITRALLSESQQAAAVVNPDSSQNADATQVFNDLERANVLSVARDGQGRVTAFSLDVSPYGEQAFAGVMNGYEQTNNPFLRLLKNFIWEYMIWNRSWDDPWAFCDMGNLAFGDGKVETFVNPAKAHVYSPQTAEKTVFKREIPEYLAAYHNTWVRIFYKQTLQDTDLKWAVTGYETITAITNQIVTAMYKGLQIDSFQLKKYIIARNVLAGNVNVLKVPELTKDTAGDVFTEMQIASGMLRYPSEDYNMGGALNETPYENQIVISTVKTNRLINVNTRATLFNLSVADYMYREKEVDSFGKFNWERLTEIFTDPVTGKVDPWFKHFSEDEISLLDGIPAILMDEKALMKWNREQYMDQIWNPEGRYWNEFLFTDDLYSFSPFANVVVLSETASTVTGVTVSPTTATVTQGQSVNLSAEVAGTGVFSQNVDWSFEPSGESNSEVSSGTYMTGSTLFIGKDEKNAQFTVTATSAQDGTKTGQSTITVQPA